MAGLDAMGEVYGGATDFPAGLALAIAVMLGACLLVSLASMLGEVAGRPELWPVVAVAFAFWPLAISGRTLLALGVLVGGLVATSILQAIADRRRQRRGKSVSQTDRRPLIGT